MRILIFSTILLIALTPNASWGQIRHTNPYLIKFSDYSLKQNHQEILENKIKSISSREFEIKKDGSKGKLINQNYLVEYDQHGNPLHYQNRHVMSCWWLPRLKQKLKLEKERVTSYDYYFQYDSSQNLIHAQEIIFEPFSFSHDENDVYFQYDEKNSLIHQTISKKTIYPPGFQYRGIPQENDTSITKYTFNYDNRNKVTTVDVWRNDSERWLYGKEFDTITYNCSFDSIFALQQPSKGIKLDSLGRVIEKTYFSVHAMPAGGGECLTSESQSDVITNYFYDNKGRLYKAEQYLRRGDFISRYFWKYDSTGLLLSSQYENSREITIYEYERY